MERPTQAIIHLENLKNNFSSIQKIVDARVAVMPVIKANAYGHGIVKVAQLLESLHCQYVAVAIPEEGVRLRQEGVQTPILVFGGFTASQTQTYVQHQLTATISSIEQLETLASLSQQQSKACKIHIKIDTGMGRVGILASQAQETLTEIYSCLERHPQVDAEGIYSHLANSDSPDLEHASQQIDLFKEVLCFYKNHNKPLPRYIHIANSGALLNLPQSYMSPFNMVRPGVLFYGVHPSPHCSNSIATQPALTLQTKASYTKELPPHHPVSYGSRWKKETATQLATLPIGYGDGYLRILSGKAQVLHQGKRLPVVGTICMDQVMVDLGIELKNEDSNFTLIGQQGSEKITCEDLAIWAGTVPHEILTSINGRVSRIYN